MRGAPFLSLLLKIKILNSVERFIYFLTLVCIREIKLYWNKFKITLKLDLLIGHTNPNQFSLEFNQ